MVNSLKEKIIQTFHKLFRKQKREQFTIHFKRPILTCYQRRKKRKTSQTKYHQKITGWGVEMYKKQQGSFPSFWLRNKIQLTRVGSETVEMSLILDIVNLRCMGHSRDVKEAVVLKLYLTEVKYKTVLN